MQFLPWLFTVALSPVVALDDPTAEATLAPLTEAEQIEHVLNRLSFGPRPGDRERLAAGGWKAWVESQLDPTSIDDAALDSWLDEHCPSLKLSMAGAWRVYWPKLPDAFDELERKLQDELVARRNEQREKIQRELRESIIVRALRSERQLQEVIVDFWRNHLNIDQTKGDVRYLLNHYESRVIRKHAFGKFDELILASAQHPAMLIYLDNEISQKPLTKRERETIEQLRRKRRENPEAKFGEYAKNLERYSGLNENYARELLELHCLGVDNVYTQKDVRELARALTGWTHGWHGEPYDSRYGFLFRAKVHDTGRKRILGRKYAAKTAAEGEAAIRNLARHKGTARFIAWKLCRYFVNDEPPEALVEDVAKVFRSSKGDLPKVYRALFLHPEFMNRAHFRAKFKSPFELVISALRASNAQLSECEEVLFMLHRMGQPLCQCEDPTGYFDQTEAWLDPGVLVHRWDFALRLASGELPGVEVPEPFFAQWDELPKEERRAQLIDTVFPGGLDERTRRATEKAWSLRRLLGLLLGSPKFQHQ